MTDYLIIVAGIVIGVPFVFACCIILLGAWAMVIGLALNMITPHRHRPGVPGLTMAHLPTSKWRSCCRSIEGGPHIGAFTEAYNSLPNKGLEPSNGAPD